LDLPDVPASLWPLLTAAAGQDRLALVGGAVRDLLLHHQHRDPWRGLVDLDLVIDSVALRGAFARGGELEGASPAWHLVSRLSRAGCGVTVLAATPHGNYGTVELELELHPQGSGTTPVRLLLDVASARGEQYPVAGDNPEVRFGALEDDLARRDLSINAMAIDLATGTLLDPHGGQEDLAARQLRFLHPHSLRDDPTRLVRAARYAARLGFRLSPESRSQALRTMAAWPWAWTSGDPPAAAPAALGTRLRRELELLLEREEWRKALHVLRECDGLLLFDSDLQADLHWLRRLRWATRLGLPRLVAFVAAARDPLALAERLQLPQRQCRLLGQVDALRRSLRALAPGSGGAGAGVLPATPWQWCQRLEAPSVSPEAVALALACGVGPRRPLLRWWGRWRFLEPERSARDWLAAGVPPGPALGERLRHSRQERVERERL